MRAEPPAAALDCAGRHCAGCAPRAYAQSVLLQRRHAHAVRHHKCDSPTAIVPYAVLNFVPLNVCAASATGGFSLCDAEVPRTQRRGLGAGPQPPNLDARPVHMPFSRSLTCAFAIHGAPQIYVRNESSDARLAAEVSILLGGAQEIRVRGGAAWWQHLHACSHHSVLTLSTHTLTTHSHIRCSQQAHALQRCFRTVHVNGTSRKRITPKVRRCHCARAQGRRALLRLPCPLLGNRLKS